MDKGDFEIFTYYKGEEKCPFDWFSRTKRMFWEHERRYYFYGYKDDSIDSYFDLIDFPDDDVPVELKKLLFKHYAFDGYSEMEAAFRFSQWYVRTYRGFKVEDFTPFDYVGKYSEGLIRVKKGIFPNVKCGFIDVNKQIVIPLIYTGAKSFSEGYAAIKIGNWANGKWGFINQQGKLMIPYIFDKVYPFSDGYAKVILNGKWCFVDKNGRVKIDLSRYNGSNSFHGGYTYVWKYEERHCDIFLIDKNETILLSDNKGSNCYIGKIEKLSNEKSSKFYKYRNNLISVEEFRKTVW